MIELGQARETGRKKRAGCVLLRVLTPSLPLSFSLRVGNSGETMSMRGGGGARNEESCCEQPGRNTYAGRLFNTVFYPDLQFPRQNSVSNFHYYILLSN